MRMLMELPRRKKALLVLALDTILLPLSLWMAFGFRLGPLNPGNRFGLIDPLVWLELTEVIVILVGSFIILAASKLQRIKLHSIDLDGIRRIAITAGYIGLFAAIASFFLEAESPRSIPILYGASFFLLAVSVRIGALQILRAATRISKNRTPVAIYGAGSAGTQLATSLKQSAELNPVMFIDDNPNLHDVVISGIRVKPRRSLRRAVKEGRINQVLIAMPSLKPDQQNEVVSEIRSYGCSVQVMPSYVDLITGRVPLETLRKVGPDDLLSRGVIDLKDPNISATYAGQSVMVTGAGGSIGSELCRQLLECNPENLVLFERSEPALYEIAHELQPIALARGVQLSRVLGSVTDEAAVSSAVRDNKISVILHAAAYKHVPMLEENEVEAARNNIFGTQIITDVAEKQRIDRFILVSTDKAVRPTNVMGATKRLAELVVGDAQRKSGHAIYSFVRFGNVLGSSGSVVPLFSKQIARGGPVTVTHKDVTRFFMTIPEAAGLVLLAGAYANGNDLFVLDMGEPVKIIDLAKRMIKLSGRTLCSSGNPTGDIAIEFTGLRPGEKLYEELLVDDNELAQTPHPKILRALMGYTESASVQSMLLSMQQAVQNRDSSLLRQILTQYVEGFDSRSYRDADVLEFKKN